jgi:Mannosyltransferase (PIG-V)
LATDIQWRQIWLILRIARNIPLNMNDQAQADTWSRRAFAGAGRFLAASSTRSALFAFTLTRLLILCVVLLSANLRFDPAVRDQFGEIHESSISLRATRVPDVLRRVTQAADSLWIINIARDGYEKEPFNTDIQHTWAYFPLYPLLLHLIAMITGDLPLTGIVLSSGFFLFALILLHKTVTEFDYEQAIADRTIFYVAAFPASYFFSLAQTESLFLLLIVGCFYAARRQRWWLAGVIGALASATRFAGIFLVIPLAILYWQSRRASKPSGDRNLASKSQGESKRRTDVISLLLVPLGLIAFMVYLKEITGNALAFADIQLAWGHSAAMFWRPFVAFLTDPWRVSAGWDFRLLNFTAAVTALVCGIVLLKRREWALGLYTLVSVIVPLSYQVSLQSLARYVIVLFPVFIVLALVGRSPRADQVVRAVSIGLLCLMSAMLAARVTMAMS